MIDLNLLQVRRDPSLIFTANTPDRKGLAFKTYTIDVPNNSHNNALLGGLFSTNAYLPVTFDAKYRIDNHLFIGTLTIDSINEISAKATFVSGNGYLWGKMGTVRMRDLDWSGYDTVLNKANVTGSESGDPFLLFDLADRGAFKNERAIDITDRYPAINLKQLLVKLFHDFGTFVTFEEWLTSLSDKYLLYTQDNNVRNSNQWLQDSVFVGEEETISYFDTTTPVGLLEWDEKIAVTTVTDNGSNWSGDEYTIPEDGTYRFILKIEKYYVEFYDDQGGVPVIAVIPPDVDGTCRLTFSIKKNGTDLIRVRTIETLTSGLYNIIDLTDIEVDTKPIQLSAGDVITFHTELFGNIKSFSIGTMLFARQDLTTTVISNQLSRWYGAGSTIEVSTIVPDMTVLDFIKAVLNDFNLDVFYNDLTGQALIRSGKDMSVAGTLVLFNWEQDIQQQADVLLEFKHDKARVPDDYLIKFSSPTRDEEVIDMATARTYVGSCWRLFGNSTAQIPVLWQAGDPADWQQAELPPAQLTTAALRFVQRLPNASQPYKLTYGGDAAQNEDTISSALQLTDIDYRTLHLYDRSLQDVVISGRVVNIPINKLADMTYFRRPVEVIDFTRGGQITTGWLLEATTSDGVTFSVKVHTAATDDIDTTQTSRAVVDLRTNTSATGGGGAGTVPAPTDVWVKVTNGIKTTENVGVNDDPLTTAVMRVKGKTSYQHAINVEDIDQTLGTIKSTCFSSSGTSQAPVPLLVERKTSGTPGNGIGMSIPFVLPNSAGTPVTGAYFLVQLITATAGAEVAQWSVIVNALQRIELTDGVFRVVNADQQIDSDRAYYLGDKSTDGSWRMIRSSNNLLMQRRESGTWVTKQTITP